MYVDNATLIPTYGHVLFGPVGTKKPTSKEIRDWLNDGATAKLGALEPIGHTSRDTLPSFESETEGGEKKGSWSNPDLDTTPLTTTESFVVQFIQWTEEAIKHRYGNGTLDPKTGSYTIPDTYEATERAALIIMNNGDKFVAEYRPRVKSAPEGSLELGTEDYAAMPVKYSILKASGHAKGYLISGFLESNGGDTTTRTEGTSGSTGTNA